MRWVCWKVVAGTWSLYHIADETGYRGVCGRKPGGRYAHKAEFRFLNSRPPLERLCLRCAQSPAPEPGEPAHGRRPPISR